MRQRRGQPARGRPHQPVVIELAVVGSAVDDDRQPIDAPCFDVETRPRPVLTLAALDRHSVELPRTAELPAQLHAALDGLRLEQGNHRLGRPIEERNASVTLIREAGVSVMVVRHHVDECRVDGVLVGVRARTRDDPFRGAVVRLTGRDRLPWPPGPIARQEEIDGRHALDPPDCGPGDLGRHADDQLLPSVGGVEVCRGSKQDPGRAGSAAHTAA